MTNLRVLLHVAAQRDYKLHSLDFSTAFLQGSLHEEIWLRRPPRFIGTFPPGTQWSQRRLVYSPRQAPREWHDTLRTNIAALGFHPSSADPSMFVRSGPTPFFVLVYVDNLVFATENRTALAEVRSELQKRHTCTNLGELRRYLGLQITRDRAARTITLTQPYMVHSATQPTPLAVYHRLTGPFPDEPFESSGPYAELVGCLMYLMTSTRPELAFPLNVLSRFVATGRHCPVHWTSAVRVAKHLATTLGMGLVLGGTQLIVLIGLCETSYADDVETQRSTQGYYFNLGARVVPRPAPSAPCPTVTAATATAATAAATTATAILRAAQLWLRFGFSRLIMRADRFSLTPQALYDSVLARYSSPATAALGRLLLPYLFPELSAFTKVEDLVSHLRASDACYRAAVPAEFLDRNPPPMYITLYFIVTRLPDSLRSVRDHSLDPTSLTVDLLEQHLLAAETSAVVVGAARGTPRPPFFEGCSPSPLGPSYASAAAAVVSIPEDVRAASASAKRRSSKGKGGWGGGGGSGGGGGGSGSGGGGSSGGGGGGGTVGGSGGSGGSGGGNGGSGGSGGGGTGSGGTGARHVGSGSGQRQQQQHQSETPSPQQLREWFLHGASRGSCPYVIRTGDRAGQTCGRLHTQHRSFSRLDDAWRAEFGDDVELPRWADLLKSRIATFDLDFDAILSAMYALSVSAKGTQWSLQRPVYGLRQVPREWHDTLRTTLVALRFAPATTDPSLFLRTDTSLPPFYVLVYVDDLVFDTADTKAQTLVKSELQKRHTCTDLGELRSYLGLQITRDRARRTINPTQSHMVHQVLQRFGFQFSSPQPTPLSTSHSLSAPPLDESIEPSGSYPELVGCLMYLMTCTRPDLAYPLSLLARYVAPGTHRKVHLDVAKRVLRHLCSTSGMGLVLGGRGPVVLTGHADALWVDDSATQQSSQGYTFSLGSGSVSWRSTHSSSVLNSSCEAEIYAGAMAAQELRWLTYLLTDLGEQPRLPLVLYVDNKAMIALCQEH
ncbi:unnamed protein product [Closterium sp. NIES-54]